MNRLLITLSLLSLMTYALNGNAQRNEQDLISVKKIKVKCYVQLYGGNETIVYHMIKAKKISSLEKTLVNKKVMTTTSINKEKIYQVNECVPYVEKFTNNNANLIEKSIAQ